jgi:two-component system cell cycle response regulator
MPAHIAGPRYGVLLIGFSTQERTLFASLFKVSGAYQDWNEGMRGKPDCILLDVEQNEARLWYDLDEIKTQGVPVIAIGSAMPGNRITASITRPLRWSGILETLGSVVANSKSNGVPVSSQSTTLLARPDLDPAMQSSLPRVYKTMATALIVNPNPTGWRYITGELSARGYRVDHVSTGEAALLLLANFRYNLMFVETQLPDEDGVGICRMLKQSQGRRKVTTVILSTNRKTVDRIRGTFAGCDAFLSAPIDADELQRTLDRLVPEYVLEKAE